MQNMIHFYCSFVFSFYTELYMRFSYGHKTERIVERGARPFFQTKTKQSDRKLREIVNQDIFLKLFFFVCLFVLRVIGHFPFGTGEIVALDVFNVDIVVFVFQFTGIGGSVLVALAAALELVRL